MLLSALSWVFSITSILYTWKVRSEISSDVMPKGFSAFYGFVDFGL